jgi:hypothetical protein
LRPPTEIVESDDNHDLDLDAGSIEGDADSFCSPLRLSSLVEDLTDMELLNACLDTIDPASRALYNLQFKLNEMGVDRNSVYEEVAMPSDHECGHINGGGFLWPPQPTNWSSCTTMLHTPSPTPSLISLVLQLLTSFLTS